MAQAGKLDTTGYERKTGTGGTLKRTLLEFKEDSGTDWAAALTYYGVLAMFPALLALTSLAGVIGQAQATTDAIIGVVEEVGSPEVVDAVRPAVEGVAEGGGGAIVALVIGVVAALWSASGYVGAFMRASNVVYEVPEGRGIVKLRPLQMLVTLLMLLIVLVAALAIVLTGPLASAVGEVIGLGGTAVTVWDFAKWPVIALLVAVAIAVMYYASPNARLRGFRSVLPGAALAVVVWILASVAFAFYVANFGNFDATYGTLGGVIIFLIWLWLTNVAIVLGAEFNSERERGQQIADGVPYAEHELSLDERNVAKDKQRPSTR
jgi:membrane protein